MQGPRPFPSLACLAPSNMRAAHLLMSFQNEESFGTLSTKSWGSDVRPLLPAPVQHPAVPAAVYTSASGAGPPPPCSSQVWGAAAPGEGRLQDRGGSGRSAALAIMTPVSAPHQRSMRSQHARPASPRVKGPRPRSHGLHQLLRQARMPALPGHRARHRDRPPVPSAGMSRIIELSCT